MGQAMTTLFRRLLGNGNLFDLYWKMVKTILRFLRQFLGGGRDTKPPPPSPPPSPPPPPPIIDRDHCHLKEQEVMVESSSISQAKSGSVNESEGSSGEVVVDNISAAAAAAPEQLKWPGKLGPYSADQKILLVGEGDFSFASSLALAFGDASNLIATSLDSLEFVMENYKRAKTNILALSSRGCKVMHRVDATTMAINLPQLRSLKFNCILFNFPRAIFSDPKPPKDAQICKHQGLIREFLRNAKQMIEVDGQIHITHQCFGSYLEWNIETLGSFEGLRLVEESPFNSREYTGYCARYGCGGSGSFNCNPSMTYKFQLPNNPKKKKTRRRRKKLEVVC